MRPSARGAPGRPAKAGTTNGGRESWNIMRKLSAVVLFGMMSTPPGAVLGAEAVDVEALKRELQELRQRTEQLERKLQAIESPPATTVTNTPAVTTPSPSAAEGRRPWSPTDPIQIGTQSAFLNISLDVLGTAGSSTEPNVQELQLGGHDPNQRG